MLLASALTFLLIWNWAETKGVMQDTGSGQRIGIEPSGNVGEGITRLRETAEQTGPEEDATTQITSDIHGKLSALRSDIDMLHRKFQGVQSDVQAMARSRKSLVDNYALDDSVTEENDLSDPANLERELEDTDLQTEAQVDLLEEALRSGDADSAWSNAAEYFIIEALQSEHLQGFELMGTECGATICRLELVLDESDTSNDMFPSLIHIAPWPGEQFFQITEGTSPEVVMYLAKEGYKLPRMARSE